MCTNEFHNFSPRTVIVALAEAGRVIGPSTEMAWVSGMAGIGVLSASRMVIALEDVVPASYAGDVRAGLWPGLVFDTDASIVALVGAIEMLVCAAIFVLPGISVSADVDT